MRKDKVDGLRIIANEFRRILVETFDDHCSSRSNISLYKLLDEMGDEM